MGELVIHFLKSCIKGRQIPNLGGFAKRKAVGRRKERKRERRRRKNSVGCFL
jgi:hypothetical protein